MTFLLQWLQGPIVVGCLAHQLSHAEQIYGFPTSGDVARANCFARDRLFVDYSTEVLNSLPEL
jgi:hypothetical protein